MTRDLNKNGDKKTEKLTEYEERGDTRIVKNTPSTTTTTHMGFGTEDQAQYDTLSANPNYTYVIFKPRDFIPDDKLINGTTHMS